ncbi:MAG TPA: proton-conducting transporter membrane subunit [Planctomycetaceae bacterium]|nr:proton-conducting transporter membrane subunit [Planctomycetaceae bacterium]
MFDLAWLTQCLGMITVIAPLVMVIILGTGSLLYRPLAERSSGRVVAASVLTSLLSSISMLVLMLVQHTQHVTVELGNWVVVPPHFHFHIKLLFDYLSLPFVILTFVLCGTIGAFATRYLHRESGYNRFFVLYSLFVLGMALSTLAGTIETLFTGWELVGLSSALLVAFYHERSSPALNGLRVWSVYRIADAAFLIAAVYLHHAHGEGDFDILLGSGPWPGQVAGVSADHAFEIGLLLMIAAAGKSALIPFSGWLPRAMEGPTPSSAIFYGALSVHLGTFLLLRVSPLLALSPGLLALIVGWGLLTAAFAALAARVQTDIKSALSFASLTQVGIIVAEIGLGLHWIALLHIIGHACIRTLQLLRAPMVLRDQRLLENAVGGRLGTAPPRRLAFLPQSAQLWFYRLGLERGYFDAVLSDYIVRPLLGMFRLFDAWERRWTDFLSGGESRDSDRVRPTSFPDHELS